VKKYISPIGLEIDNRFTDKLRTVFDPEIKENVLDMGLIYSVEESDGQITVTMTMTTPMCPFAGVMTMDVKNSLQQPDNEVFVDVTLDPPWSPEMMSEQLRDKLGFDENGKPI
jgi:metal-sulfur cluster biosynthetic enzyme